MVQRTKSKSSNMSADLMGMKESFSFMVQKVQPWILSHFMIWLDLKVAEYKVHGHMILDQTGIPSLHWLSDNVCSQPSKAPRTPFKENHESEEFEVLDQSQMATIAKQYSMSSQPYHSGSTPNVENLTSASALNASSSLSVSGHDFSTSQVIQDLPNNSRNEEIVTSLMSIASHEQRNQLVNEIDLQTHNLNTVASRSNYQNADAMVPTTEFTSKNSIDLTNEPEIKLEPQSPDNLIILDNQLSLNTNEAFIRGNHNGNGVISGMSGSHLSNAEETIHLPTRTLHIDNNEGNNIMLPLQTSHTTQSQQDINNPRNVHLSPVPLSSSEMSQEFNDRIIVQNVSTFKLQNTSRRKAGSNSSGNKKWTSSKVNNRSLNVSGSKLMCQTCGTFFRCRSSLSRHKWLHGEKRHRCFICEKAFHRKEHLYLHLERHAKCKMCHLKGNNLQAIEEHFKQCHPNAT